MKIGYKGTYNFICRDHKFEIGQTYELPNKPILCKYGFHYCKNILDVFTYYSLKPGFKLLEIEDLGYSLTDSDKIVTNKLRVIREVPLEELNLILNCKIEFDSNKLTVTQSDGSWSYFIFNEKNNGIYHEDSTGFWRKKSYDENDNLVKFENSHGDYYKHEYNEHGNEIYFESSNGFWEKKTYNEFQSLTYLENSRGEWNKYSYDSKNNFISEERSNGTWIKNKYDENNNEIYHEDSYGTWVKSKYDSKNNLIFQESSYNNWFENKVIIFIYLIKYCFRKLIK